jgi:7-cyano-7-deazaguanine synthase
MSKTSPKKAVILLSGGLDSTTTLAIAQSDGYLAYALSFDYGQRNRFEVDSAKRIAHQTGVKEHRVATIDLRAFGGSSLTSEDPVEKGRSLEQIGVGIPSTYVPVRNTLFLSFALAWAEVLDARHIFIGINEVDTSGYPDCRPAFINAFEQLAQLATRMGTEDETRNDGRRIKIHTPLQHLRKAEIIRRGLELGVDYAETNTCYDPAADSRACGTCDACQLRQRAFHELGREDPVAYVERISFLQAPTFQV